MNNEEKLRNILQVILDQVDYTSGACRVNEQVGGVLDLNILAQARAILKETKPSIIIHGWKVNTDPMEWWKEVITPCGETVDHNGKKLVPKTLIAHIHLCQSAFCVTKLWHVKNPEIVDPLQLLDENWPDGAYAEIHKEIYGRYP